MSEENANADKNDSALSPEQREQIAPVLGRIPSGLSILTVIDPPKNNTENNAENETGMLASWVQQVSFEPPMITIAVNRQRYLNDWLSDGVFVAVNLLAESNGSYLKHFGRGFEPGEPAFDGLEIARSENGLPVLTDTLGFLEARICGQLSAGDHILYTAEVTSAGSGPLLDQKNPFVHVRKNGFHY